MNKGSWLREADHAKLIFETPLWFRLVAWIMALLFATVPQILTLAEFQSAVANPSKAVFDYTILELWLLMDSSVVLLFLWLGAGTCLSIDLESRSYLHRRRWPFGRQVQRGTLDEMSGVCLMGEDLSQVLLLFKNAPSFSKGYRLGMYSSQRQAKSEAQEFARMLEVPVVKSMWE